MKGVAEPQRECDVGAVRLNVQRGFKSIDRFLQNRPPQRCVGSHVFQSGCPSLHWQFQSAVAEVTWTPPLKSLQVRHDLAEQRNGFIPFPQPTRVETDFIFRIDKPPGKQVDLMSQRRFELFRLRFEFEVPNNLIGSRVNQLSGDNDPEISSVVILVNFPTYQKRGSSSGKRCRQTFPIHKGRLNQIQFTQ